MNAPKTWFSAAELAGLPGLPGTERAIQLKSARQSWPHRKRAGRGGGREYPLDALPPATRSHLAARIVAAARRAAAGGTAPSGALEPPPPAHSPNGSPPLAGLAGGAKTRAEARLAVLAAFDAFRRAAGCGFRAAEHLFAARYNSAGARAEPDMVSPDVRAELPAVSAASLRNWRRLAAREGAGRLAGRYGTRARNGRIDRNPALRDHILAMLIHQPHLAAHQILAGLRVRIAAGALPSKRRLQHWLARWKDENRALFAQATDPDAAKSRFRPAFGKADETVRRLNQLWELDATPADVMLKDGRHAVVGVIDVASRRAKVLVARTSKATAVTALIRRAILAWGVPEAAKTDNGQDFVARHVVSALAALGIRHDLCPPFSPENKPHIERFFRTLSHDLFERLPGYVGHNVAERQAIRARESFARRLGRDDAETFAVAMTAAELQSACDAWCESLYARRPHEGLGGRTPFEIAAAQARAARFVENPRALDALLAEAPGDA